MPTPEQVKEWRALRGRFLNALWDAEHADVDFAQVSDLLNATGDSGLPDHHVDRLVANLSDDGLIEGITFAEGPAQQVRLTSAGRYEVEEWIGDPDKPTEHLPVPANQVFNIGSMNVTGPVLQGSTATNVVTSYGESSEVLLKVVAEFRKLLTAVDLPEDDREAVEADLEMIEEETNTTQPRPNRLRAGLRRLRGALTTGAFSGVEASSKEEVMELIQRALGG